MTGHVRLSEADSSCGGKAAALGRLARAGFPVPDGVVLSGVTAGPQGDGPATLVPPAAPAWLEPELRRLGGHRFAVRSSATGEDSAGASFAGQLLTVLDVPADRVLDEAVRVAASGVGASAYATATGRATPHRVQVLVQPMLRPVAAGVAFTRHPVTGARTTVVEAVRGAAEASCRGPRRPRGGRSPTGTM